MKKYPLNETFDERRLERFEERKKWRRLYLKNGIITPHEAFLFDFRDFVEILKIHFFKMMFKPLVWLTKMLNKIH